MNMRILVAFAAAFFVISLVPLFTDSTGCGVTSGCMEITGETVNIASEASLFGLVASGGILVAVVLCYRKSARATAAC